MSDYEDHRRKVLEMMVESARRATQLPGNARNTRDALLEREYRQKAWSELIRWKKQVPELVPETDEELQEGLNRA